ncbi:hypothetical protein FRC14_005804 [Serendipita sp. 396]|nr:hypothetical protein FRC14_005804 [Serendipita sp. 396]
MQSDSAANQLDGGRSIATAISEFTALQGHADGRNLHILAPKQRDILTEDDMVKETARKLLETLRKANYSFNAATSYPISDQRVISLYRESSKHEYSIHKAARSGRMMLQSLRPAHESAESINYFRPSMYGIPVPSLRSQVASFVFSSLSKWAAAAKLEYFLEESHSDAQIPFPSTPGPSDQITIPSPKEVTVSLSTEQLLVDFVFERDRIADNPRIDLPQNRHIVPLALQQVKITVGDKDDVSLTPDGHLGGTLHDLLEEKMRKFLHELGCGGSKAWENVDSRRVEGAAAEVTTIFHDLNWMVEVMKREEATDPARAIAWWYFVPSIADRVMSILRLERSALVRAASDSTGFSPNLDTLILRCGAIPFPYLNSLSLGFVPYIPPLAYLTLLRTYRPDNTNETSMDTDTSLSAICDISVPHIRSLISNEDLRRKLDVPVATLSYDRLSFGSTTFPSTMNSAVLHGDVLNAFPLDEPSSSKREELANVVFMTPPAPDQGSTSLRRWKLNILVGVQPAPLIVSQSRMKRIAAIIGLHADPEDVHDLDLISLGGAPTEVGPSWLDLTVDPWCTQPSRVYTSKYAFKTSPGSTDHIDVANTLLPVTEPGFALGDIPVQNLKQVLSILFVVKEQLWLRGMILGAGFQHGYASNEATRTSSGADIKTTQEAVDREAAKALFESLLNNTYVPTRLRATYEILGDGRTGIRISFPLEGHVTLVEVTLDLQCPTGMRITVDGDRIEALEEVVRRGGLLALLNAMKMRSFKT